MQKLTRNFVFDSRCFFGVVVCLEIFKSTGERKAQIDLKNDLKAVGQWPFVKALDVVYLYYQIHFERVYRWARNVGTIKS